RSPATGRASMCATMDTSACRTSFDRPATISRWNGATTISCTSCACANRLLGRLPIYHCSVECIHKRSSMVDISEMFNCLVSVGFFSRAILYSVLGLIALTSAGRIAQGTNGIFRAIQDFPLGTAILWLMVVGLLAYALFRFASLFFDIENNG